MATIFKHKNEIYQCVNLQKKLKRLEIDESDIEILFEGELSQSELEKKYLELIQDGKEEIDHNEIKLYSFYNPKTKETILSIYPDLERLGKHGEGFESI